MINPKIILGIMSGTSLDGLDFALCKFKKQKQKYYYEILETGFFPYNDKIKNELSNAQNLKAFDFIELHKKYGKYIGKKTKQFLSGKIIPDYIASHGHTIFHKPKQNITFQIGDGAFIVAETKISVISDFRNIDTALKGQGAPLVPIGDKHLFSEYDFCINLGGFANVSYNKKGKRIAFDICPVNFIVNNLMRKIGKEYDEFGNTGKKGKINQELLKQLNSIPFYTKKPPKSLGREYVEKWFFPLIQNFNISVNDKIRTLYKHIAIKISDEISSKKNGNVLLTGGGTHNKFLVSEIQAETKNKIIIPDNQTIDFKEAIIFAFLGFLRINSEINTLKSVTGALKDSIGGAIFVS